MNSTTRQALGWMTVFLSAFCFYISTVIIRWSQSEAVIAPSYFVFVRFILGFLVVCIIMTWQKRLPAPRSYHLLVGRTIANCVAVYCFYMAVNHTTIAEANILNMTYPVFVAILSWVFLHQQRDLAALFMVAVAFAGIWLILAPGRIDFKTENLWGLASGISASFAILYLNISRQYHDTNTVPFFHVRSGYSDHVCPVPLFFFLAGSNRLLLPDDVRHLWCGRAVSAYHRFSLCHGCGGQYYLLHENFSGRLPGPLCGLGTSPDNGRLDRGAAPILRQCRTSLSSKIGTMTH